jgi:hypothetical protein
MAVLGCAVRSRWSPAGSVRRRCRPGTVDADKAYDHAANRAYLRRRGIRPRIARRGVELSARLGGHRWRIERTLSCCLATGVWQCDGIATRSGGSRSFFWPARWSASTGSSRPRKCADVSPSGDARRGLHDEVETAIDGDDLARDPVGCGVGQRDDPPRDVVRSAAPT